MINQYRKSPQISVHPQIQLNYVILRCVLGIDIYVFISPQWFWVISIHSQSKKRIQLNSEISDCHPNIYWSLKDWQMGTLEHQKTFWFGGGNFTPNLL